jgi:hypothetical protein
MAFQDAAECEDINWFLIEQYYRIRRQADIAEDGMSFSSQVRLIRTSCASICTGEL